MKAGNLVFMTEENEARLKEVVPPELFAAKQEELRLKGLEATAPERLEVKHATDNTNKPTA